MQECYVWGIVRYDDSQIHIYPENTFGIPTLVPVFLHQRYIHEVMRVAGALSTFAKLYLLVGIGMNRSRSRGVEYHILYKSGRGVSVDSGDKESDKSISRQQVNTVDSHVHVKAPLGLPQGISIVCPSPVRRRILPQPGLYYTLRNTIRGVVAVVSRASDTQTFIWHRRQGRAIDRNVHLAPAISKYCHKTSKT